MRRFGFVSLAILPLLLLSCSNNSLEVDVASLKAFIPTMPTIENKNVGEPHVDDNGDIIFDIYSLSDFHGAIVSDEEAGRIGLSRLGTYFDNKRTLNPGGTILLAVGDMFQGSVDSNLTYGNSITYAMNLMQFDAFTLGNHEFDWGEEWIIDNVNRASFPFLGANIVQKDTSILPSYLNEYAVITRGDYNIGIIGTIGDNIRNTIYEGVINNLDFLNEVEIVDNLAQELRDNEDCDIVLWCSHNGYDSIQNKVATLLPNVDAIFSAHTHMNYNGYVSDDNIPLAETTNYGEAIAHVQLKLDVETNEVSCLINENDQNLFLSASSEDKNISSIVDQYAKKFVNPYKNIKIGKLANDFSINELANFACKSMLDRINSEYSGKFNAVASFHNRNGGVRVSLKEGNLTFGQLYEAFPFDNELVVLDIDGATLKRYLDAGGNNSLYRLIDYADVDNQATYQIVTTDFLASGSNTYTSYDDIFYTKLNVRDVVMDNIIALCGVNALGCSSKAINSDDYVGSDYSLSML